MSGAAGSDRRGQRQSGRPERGGRGTGATAGRTECRRQAEETTRGRQAERGAGDQDGTRAGPTERGEGDESDGEGGKKAKGPERGARLSASRCRPGTGPRRKRPRGWAGRRSAVRQHLRPGDGEPPRDPAEGQHLGAAAWEWEGKARGPSVGQVPAPAAGKVAPLTRGLVLVYGRLGRLAQNVVGRPLRLGRCPDQQLGVVLELPQPPLNIADGV